MIAKEFYTTRKEGVYLYRTYSTDGFKIKKIGTDEVYDEAIDVASSAFVYEETAEPIERGETLNE